MPEFDDSFLYLPSEITIAGGGLTGLSLAIALRHHQVPVTLHEAGTYPRHRVCGEFISGVSKQTLEDLRIDHLLEDAGRLSSMRWFYQNKHLRDESLPEPALGISRHRLDYRLLAEAEKLGAIVIQKSRFQAQLEQDGTVWAAGRRPIKGKWLGLKAHVRNLPTSSHLEMHSGPVGYLGIAEVEDGWQNICGLFRIDPSIDARREGLLSAYLEANGNTQLSTKLSLAQWRTGSFTAVGGFKLGLQKKRPGILCLGDSHSIIPPFTGNGMSMAFQSAAAALPQLVRFARSEISWDTACQNIENAHQSIFKTRLLASRIAHPLLFRPIAKPLLRHAPIRPLLKFVR